eukprot:Platyproteum_vivax@DN17400_c0_g1_i1.p1
MLGSAFVKYVYWLLAFSYFLQIECTSENYTFPITSDGFEAYVEVTLAGKPYNLKLDTCTEGIFIFLDETSYCETKPEKDVECMNAKAAANNGLCVCEHVRDCVPDHMVNCDNCTSNLDNFESQY